MFVCIYFAQETFIPKSTSKFLNFAIFTAHINWPRHAVNQIGSLDPEFGQKKNKTKRGEITTLVQLTFGNNSLL